jgi:hypothetical protein
MTVAIACTVPDGVILGVDSAVTIGDPTNPLKVYEDAEKIFHLGKLPVGIAIYGAAGFGQRTIGSYLREFELRNPSGVLDEGKGSLKDIVEQLRSFFMAEYTTTMVPLVEAFRKKRFDEIPENERPGVGLIVAGFSSKSFLPEVWNVLIPLCSKPESAVQSISPGKLGSAWFASCAPVARYIKGYDPELANAVMARFTAILGRSLTPDEGKSLQDVLAASEYQIVFDAMPLQRGIEYVRFLVQLVISHHKFAVGAPIVGGSPRIGVVTYKGGEFKIIGMEDIGT